MSLTTLTFNSATSMTTDRAGRGKVKVIKTEKFVGSDDVCVIGKLMEGAVFNKMTMPGKSGTLIVSVESKYGDGHCTKEGAQVVLMVSGIRKEDCPSDSELVFERIALEQARPKGRIIIA